MHIGEEALPAEERFHVTLFACLMERAINVVFDMREGLVIALMNSAASLLLMPVIWARPKADCP